VDAELQETSIARAAAKVAILLIFI
jgi:hypothetical protein